MESILAEQKIEAKHVDEEAFDRLKGIKLGGTNSHAGDKVA
jgi:hypothetical protein